MSECECVCVCQCVFAFVLPWLPSLLYDPLAFLFVRLSACQYDCLFNYLPSKCTHTHTCISINKRECIHMHRLHVFKAFNVCKIHVYFALQHLRSLPQRLLEDRWSVCVCVQSCVRELICLDVVLFVFGSVKWINECINACKMDNWCSLVHF